MSSERRNIANAQRNGRGKCNSANKTGADSGDALVYEIELVDTESRDRLDSIRVTTTIDLVTGAVTQVLRD